MAKEQTIHLGYEVGTGTAIEVPLRHMAVTGQTQQSGKTTTLEALISRAGGTALTFVTKRGERSFERSRRIAPYFRDRADWQFVTSILDATLQEKNKFLRPWIMKICRNTQSLREVQQAVQLALRTAKGLNEGVYTQLDAYLDLIVPEIDRADLAEKLDLEPGINVMDLIDFSTPMQMLFIQSALDWINDRARNTTVVIPEAWEFVPEGKGSPVKASAIALARKGAGIGNHIWLDSQDMAGVDKTLLRACTVWLIGVQREPNEIKRNLQSIPAGMKKPKADEIASLERGQFFACFGKITAKTYVQPAWLDENYSRAIARGETDVSNAYPPGAPARVPTPAKEDEVDQATAKALTEENTRLKEAIETAEKQSFERGMEAALRQAGEYWNAAALDIRDAAKKVTDLGEHLAGVARDGRWSLPRGEAKPAAPPERSAPRKVETPADAEPSKPSSSANPNMALIDVLVRSHPLPLTADLWGEFAGKSARSGWWHSQMKALREAQLIENDGGRFAPTEKAIAASSVEPAKPKDDIELWGLWRDAIRGKVGSAAMGLLGVLYAHRPHALNAEQWGLLAEKSPRSGWWNAALKPLREWDLLNNEAGRFVITKKGAAVLGEIAVSEIDTSEALRVARRAAMPAPSQNLYDLLVQGDSKQILADRAGWSQRSGHWHGAIKGLMDSGLVEDIGGGLRHAKEKL